jgi:hypothetical protein
LEKYSKLLMHYERSRLGHLGGVQRYAELMFFNSTVRNIGYEHQNFLVCALNGAFPPKPSA